MTRPTPPQLVALAEFLEQHPGIARALLRTNQAKEETKRRWHQVAPTLNALDGARKDGKGWAKYWADKKCALKKICIQHLQSVKQSGESVALPLSDIDQRLVAATGGVEVVAGSQGDLPGFSGEKSVPTHSTELDDNQASDNSSNETSMRVPFIKTEESETEVQEQVRERSPLATRQRHPSVRRRVSRHHINRNRGVFVTIGKGREGATAQAIKEAAKSLASVASAINNLASAVTESAHTIAAAINSAKK